MQTYLHKLRAQILVLLLFASGASISRAAETLEQQVDRLMSPYNRPDVPGAAIGIFRGPDILLNKAYGMRNLENHQPSTITTNFRTASLTKAFTATAIMQLVEAGHLTLDATIQDYFPNFPDYGSRITIKHLLSHTSGFQEYELLMPPDYQGQITDKEVLALLANERSGYFTPGSRFRYSNSGYAILACIVEQITSTPFQDYLRDHIFLPLQMHQTVAYVKNYNDVVERAYGYSPNGNGFKFTDQSSTSAVLGDGGIYSSIRDLHQWLQMWSGGNSVLRPTSMTAMTEPNLLNSGKATNYGFGWFVDQFGDTRKISHTGSTIGQKHAIAFYPEKNLGIVILVNRENAAPWEILDSIAARLIREQSAAHNPEGLGAAFDLRLQ